jgi:DNA-directed RNA polymerase subunit RPC12/RpoP
MDITFNCPNCDQELAVDASGAGSDIECPSCSQMITVPAPEPEMALATGGPGPATPAASAAPPGPPREDKRYSVPVHEHAAEALIKKPSVHPLDVIANEGDKKLRIRTIRRTDCQEVNKDCFDERVSAFLEKIGPANIVSINTINYSFVELSTHHLLQDYGVMIVFKG